MRESSSDENLGRERDHNQRSQTNISHPQWMTTNLKQSEREAAKTFMPTVLVVANTRQQQRQRREAMI